MPNRLANAASPYLRSHAGNPVDWWPWAAEAFAEAARRDVPVMVSIGYSTCHWCHVMARESFSDPEVAAIMNANLVAIKVDREEHAEVDSTYLAAAGAFTPNLGWPLNVFVTPQGRAFFAGTYWPPSPVGGHPAFRQVLGAVLDAWRDRRDEVEHNGAAIVAALGSARAVDESALVTDFTAVVGELESYEDTEFGGFGGAPKFPVTPVLRFLVDRDEPLGARTLDIMAASPLRDRVDGGFFRYSTQRDWSEPHYERMLYDNAQLVAAYATASSAEAVEALEALESVESVESAESAESVESVEGDDRDAGVSASRRAVAEGIANFLITTLQLPSGGFASAQDSESTVDGARVEGFYYSLDAASRARLDPPPLDEKILTGWNGLAIEGLAIAGTVLQREDWIAAARRAADFVLDRHVLPNRLVRTSIAGVVSAAHATLEDFGMLAHGLLHLATATGEVRYAIAARSLVDASMTAGEPFGVPDGADPVLAAQGITVAADESDGAHPSGLSAMAAASYRVYLLTANSAYRDAAARASARVAAASSAQPIAYGAALGVMSALASAVTQLVIVGEGVSAPSGRYSVSVVVSQSQCDAFAAAGFELFEGRRTTPGVATAYLCEDFVCQLPTVVSS